MLFPLPFSFFKINHVLHSFIFRLISYGTHHFAIIHSVAENHFIYTAIYNSVDKNNEANFPYGQLSVYFKALKWCLHIQSPAGKSN